MEVMRVGLIGAHSSGKTTLVEAFCNKFNWVVPVTSASRDACEAGFKLNRNAGRLDQLVVTVSRINKEDKAVENNKNSIIISDRTPLDSLAYTIYQNDNCWHEDAAISDYYMNLSKDISVRHMKKYDRIVFLRSLNGVEDDGVREVDREYQQSIEKIMKSLLFGLGLEYLDLPASSLDERLYLMTKYIFSPTPKIVL